MVASFINVGPAPTNQLQRCYITESTIFTPGETMFDMTPALTQYRDGSGGIWTPTDLNSPIGATEYFFRGGSFQYLIVQFTKKVTCTELLISGSMTGDRPDIKTQLTRDGLASVDGLSVNWRESGTGSYYVINDLAGLPFTKLRFGCPASGGKYMTFKRIMPISDERIVRQVWRDLSTNDFYNDNDRESVKVTVNSNAIITLHPPFPLHAYSVEELTDSIGPYRKIVKV